MEKVEKERRGREMRFLKVGFSVALIRFSRYFFVVVAQKKRGMSRGGRFEVGMI